MTYSDEELRDALRAFAAAHDGRSPTATEANAHEEFPAAQTFVNHFGSWNAAVEAAGLAPRHRRRTNAELLAALREFAEENPDESLSQNAVAHREDMPDPQTLTRRFGSWSATLDAAGLPVYGKTGEP